MHPNVADAATKATTRLLLMYNLVPRIRIDRRALRPLTHALDFGRFEGHVDAAEGLLPQLVFRADLDATSVAFPTVDDITAPDPDPPIPARAAYRRAGIILAATPRLDPLLLVEVELGGDATATEVAGILFASWRNRTDTIVDGLPIIDWLTEHLRADHGYLRDEPGLTFGRNVHQCVLAGGSLADQIITDNTEPDRISAEAITMVLRGTLTSRAGVPLGLQRPETLNNPGETVLVHGRGVTLAAGWTTGVENSFALAALGILNAVAVVHRVRRRAFDALQLNESTQVTSTASMRELVAELSRALGNLQLDLSFSIEAYADTILIPELLVESYHSSLRRISALADGLANTAQIVARVGAVIGVRNAMLESAAQEYSERRDKVMTVIIAAGTLVALPPTLLLAFFGANVKQVDADRSIFDLHHYGVAYALAWLPFIVLVTAGLMVRRQFRIKLPNLSDRPAVAEDS